MSNSFVIPWTISPPGFSILGISQARILEWLPFPSPKRKISSVQFSSVTQSCPTLCDPIDGSPPGSPVPGILQARILEWLPFPSPTHERKSESGVTQSCPTLHEPMDFSLPGSSIHGIFQADYWSGLPLPSVSFIKRLLVTI